MPRALVWYRKAADLGFAAAQHLLGEGYYLGEYLLKDLAAAKTWLQKAAEQGDREAMLDMGMCCLEADSMDAAFPCFRQAAQRYHPEATQAYNSLFTLRNRLKLMSKGYQKLPET